MIIIGGFIISDLLQEIDTKIYYRDAESSVYTSGNSSSQILGLELDDEEGKFISRCALMYNKDKPESILSLVNKIMSANDASSCKLLGLEDSSNRTTITKGTMYNTAVFIIEESEKPTGEDFGVVTYDRKVASADSLTFSYPDLDDQSIKKIIDEVCDTINPEVVLFPNDDNSLGELSYHYEVITTTTPIEDTGIEYSKSTDSYYLVVEQLDGSVLSAEYLCDKKLDWLKFDNYEYYANWKFSDRDDYNYSQRLILPKSYQYNRCIGTTDLIKDSISNIESKIYDNLSDVNSLVKRDVLNEYRKKS